MLKRIIFHLLTDKYSGLLRIFGDMKIPRLSTRTKASSGYILLLILLVSVLYGIVSTMESLTAPNQNEVKMTERRRCTNEVIYNLYQAEIISHTISSGELSVEEEYFNKITNAKNAIVRLRELVPEQEQQRLDSLNILIDKKTENQRNLIIAIRNNRSDELYQGYIEAREIPHHGADVVVADAFTGNVILKLYEGTASMLVKTIKKAITSDFKSKIGALLIKDKLKEQLKSFDASQYGGAPLLGLKGLVVKCHGNAKAAEISNGLIQCETFVNAGINEELSAALQKDNELFKQMKEEKEAAAGQSE